MAGIFERHHFLPKLKKMYKGWLGDRDGIGESLEKDFKRVDNTLLKYTKEDYFFSIL